MTIKKRLFWSNILMILVPVISAALVGALCIGFLWLALVNRAGLGFRGQEDFELACLAVTEAAEHRLDSGADLEKLAGLLDSNGMTMLVLRDGEAFFSHGEAQENDRQLLSAAQMLGQDATVTWQSRSLHIRRETIHGQEYTICLLAGYANARAYAGVKAAVVLSGLLIAAAIVLSVWFTNRFLIGFVFKRIEEPLDILAHGVHELRDGNLDYRIAYNRQDEFDPVCRDFNEMAERLKATVAQLNRQERSRKELIAGISHDIRSPLTSIQAYVEGLLDGVAKTPEARRRYLETVKRKAEDLEHIVSQLFLFSKMELEDFPENPCALRLDAAIRETVSAVQEEYLQKGLAISMELEPAVVRADPAQIQRIVLNLLDNSRKYSDKAQAALSITLRQEDTGCRLSFADDGPGVPPASLPRLFDVFYRSDPSRQNPHQGSGLGLAIVASAVRRMGGTIQAALCTPRGLEIIMEFPKERMEDGQDSDC